MHCRHVAAVAVVSLSACQAVGIVPAVPSKAPATQDRAGSAHIAVLSVAPWQEYASALQPKFAMDEAQALQEAIPNTLEVERRLTDVLALTAKVALPSSTTRSANVTTATSVGTAVTSADGTTAETTNRQNSVLDTSSGVRQSGNVASVAVTPLPSKPEPILAANSPLQSATTLDPFVKYAAATSLLQEVRVLQRYVRDVVIGPKSEGYVVRLQVTLMPSQRDLPLDAYTTLSFFTTVRDSGSARPLRLGLTGAVNTAPGTRNVRVVPIMVSDNLEGASEAASTAALRQVSLGLLGSLAGAGLSADGGRLVQRLEALLGRELNSLLTVGQISDNTLRIRFGAMNQPRGGLGLVPRNQMVTVLIVIPADIAPSRTHDQVVRIASRTDFVNALTGVPLRPQTRHDLYDRVDRALKEYDVHVDEEHPAVAEMLAAVQEGSLSRFSAALARIEPNCKSWSRHCPPAVAQRRNAAQNAEAIWLDVGSILATLPYSLTNASLPLPWVPKVDDEQFPLAIDDGKGLTLTVAGDPTLQASEFSAWLRVAADSGTIPASSVDVDARGRIRVVFPSPPGTQLCSVDNAADPHACKINAVRLCRTLARWEASDTSCHAIRVAYRAPPKAADPKPPAGSTAAGFRLSAGARVVAASEAGDGIIRLTIVRQEDAKPGAKLKLRIDGADVQSMSLLDPNGARRTLAATEGAFELTSSGTLTVVLANLDASEPVVVSGDGAIAPARVQFRVVRKR